MNTPVRTLVILSFMAGFAARAFPLSAAGDEPWSKAEPQPAKEQL